MLRKYHYFFSVVHDECNADHAKNGDAVENVKLLEDVRKIDLTEVIKLAHELEPNNDHWRKKRASNGPVHFQCYPEGVKVLKSDLKEAFEALEKDGVIEIKK